MNELLSNIIQSMPYSAPIYLGETDHKLGSIKATWDDDGTGAIRLWFNSGECESE